ncbi:MAG: hypothetical protein COB25_000210 [Oceanospirillales bacterium]|nr:hypothetical protein [Oceanospirillales bacterium]
MNNLTEAETSPKPHRTQLLVRLQNISHRAHHSNWRRLQARFIEILIRLIWSAHLAPEAKIASSTHFAHNGLGVIIHPLSEIGENCWIGPHIVLGGKAPIIGAPTLGKNVTLHAGAKIIGKIHIGDGSIIGANAVVTKDIGPNCVAVGVPAEILKSNIDANDYR